MKIAGIVAEYNPFHKGHAYQIETLRAMGFDGIVAAMSGNFVQRADTALIDKYARARAAVRGGADLVLELPLPYAMASAEDFAFGGISVLAATGILDAICCGC
ncbi:MAG: nucleotidyltransferase family protein, partial [Clostridia bacterium]|nr:nucleotidyltransferase family protein [Clostridia bacterium]